MMELELFLLFGAFSFGISQTTELDPCVNYKIIDDDTRAANLKIDLTVDIPYSDDRIKDGWYRVQNNVGEDMIMEPPGYFMCTTWYPIWLNGSLPTEINQTTTEQACLQTFMDICELTWNIQIKRCPEGYLLYGLKSSPVIDSGYCFGWADPCASGESSETGKEPGCSSDFPHMTLSPYVKSELKEGEILNPNLGPSLIPVFRCVIPEFSTNYVYDIYWAINNVSIVSFQNTAVGNLRDTDLLPTHWSSTYKLNMMVKCYVRVRNAAFETPSQKFESAEFFAGIIVEHDNPIVVREGQVATIILKLTVPPGCFVQDQSYCSVDLYIRQPQKDPDSCLNNVLRSDLTFDRKFCGIIVPSLQWDKAIQLNLTGNVDNAYNRNLTRSTIIKLTSRINDLDPSGIWYEVSLPDIQVVVRDSDIDIKDKMCMVPGGWPVITLGKNVFSFHAVGEFVLLRSINMDFAVHILKTNNIDTSVADVCGIAIRSYSSLFVVRTCNVISEINKHDYDGFQSIPSVTSTKNFQKDMKLFMEGDSYKIILPSGTEITFRLDRYWIRNILIKPSVLDVDSVRGLCEGMTINDIVGFVTQHRVSETNEQLFSESPKICQYGRHDKTYCTCKHQAGPTDNFSAFNDVHCNLTHPRSYESCGREGGDELMNDNSVYDECNDRSKRYALREKRSLTDDIVIPYIPLSYDSDNEGRIIPNPLWDGNQPSDEVVQYCRNISSNLKEFEQYTSLDYEMFVSMCSYDQRGGRKMWDFTILLDACKLEIARNESLQVSRTETGGSLLEELLNMICKKECNEHHGHCIKGKCVCDNTHYGSNCSVAKTEPPTNTYIIQENGMCNTNLRPCHKSTILGSFETTPVYCKVEIVYQITSDGSFRMYKRFNYTAEYSNKYRVSCPFPQTRTKRSLDVLATVYDISLSYDGVNFKGGEEIFVYDASCVSCNFLQYTCTYVDRCRDRTQIPVEPTEFPSTTSSTEESPKERNGHQTSWMLNVMVVICTICAVLVIGVTCYCMKQHLIRIRRERKENIYAVRTFGRKLSMNNIVYITSGEKELEISRDQPPPYHTVVNDSSNPEKKPGDLASKF